MSYDLHIWSTQPVSASNVLPEPARWTCSGDIRMRAGKGWQLSIGVSDRVMPEDIPEEVDKLLPGITFLTELNLSPITAAGSAKRLMARVAAALAKSAHGVVVDPQTDTVTTAKGVSRVKTLGSSDAASVIALSWWFLSGPLIDFDVAPLLATLGSSLPEALPRRYGTYEPPQYKYAEIGREHFVSFFREQGGSIVWYPHPPIAAVSVSIPLHVGGPKRCFRCGTMTVEIDAEAMAQPGWDLAIQRAWRRISCDLQPFYGDVRTLHGFQRKRGRYWSGSQTEQHPVRAWFWSGIPSGPVHAAVLGGPYRSLWPAFCNGGEPVGELCFISTSDWCSQSDALETLGLPPSDIAKSAPDVGPPNSERWPFAWSHTPRAYSSHRSAIKYDNAAWHYDGKFPKDLPHEAAATHTGMFIAWACLLELAGELHVVDFPDDLPKLRARSITPGMFFWRCCEGKFTNDDLNDEGNAFAQAYYDLKTGKYLADYESTLGEDLEELYFVRDSWENFDRLKPVLDRRFKEWKARG